jgi:cytochrome c5
MNQSDDRTFMRKFGGIVLGLMLITVVIIILARSLQDEPAGNLNPSHQALAEKRIAPVSAVRVGEEGAAALAEAQPAAAPAATEGDDAAIDGGQVYNGLCMSCHDAGVAGAPVSGSEEMAKRASEKGIDTLVANAINGINIMPPKGGNPGLSDEQVRAAVEFMLN